jgi:hypothetical protein
MYTAIGHYCLHIHLQYRKVKRSLENNHHLVQAFQTRGPRMHYFFLFILYESVTDLLHYRMWSGSESKFLIKNVFLGEAEILKSFVILG